MFLWTCFFFKSRSFLWTSLAYFLQTYICECNPLVKVTKNYRKIKDPPFLMGKLTISITIFKSYVSLPEGICNPESGDYRSRNNCKHVHSPVVFTLLFQEFSQTQLCIGFIIIEDVKQNEDSILAGHDSDFCEFYFSVPE